MRVMGAYICIFDFMSVCVREYDCMSICMQGLYYIWKETLYDESNAHNTPLLPSPNTTPHTLVPITQLHDRRTDRDYSPCAFWRCPPCTCTGIKHMCSGIPDLFAA